MADEEAEVIIVGGGPVGLSLACDLSKRGVKTILLERNKTTSVIAKAFALNCRSMEHFRRMGVQEKIQNASLPRDVPFNVGFYSTVLNGSTALKITYASWGDIVDGKTEKGYPFYEEGISPVVPMFCAQTASEPTLKKHIETTSDCVSLFFGHKAIAISQDENGVVIQAEVDGGYETKTFKGQYVVACDGGSSPCRKLLGTHMVGKFVLARAFSVMLNSPQIYQQIKDDCKVGMSFVSNVKFTALCYIANDNDVVIHSFLPLNISDDTLKRYEQNPERVVKSVVGSDLPFTVLGCSHYSMHALISTKFRIGRVLFAGDSAHQWMPVGGLGLNTGVSDAGDLAWKLEAAVKGYGGANLLDSYEEERRPLVDSTRRFVFHLGGNTVGNANLFVFFSIPIVRLVVSWIVARFFLPDVVNSNLLTLGFQYSNSSIIMHEYNKDGKIVNPSSYGGCRYPALPGCRAPHVALPDQESTLDLFGSGFVLLVIGGEDADLQPLKDEFDQRKIPCQQFSFQKFPELAAAYDRKYFLVRPDGIVCWRSDSQPSSLESQKIVATVIGDNNCQRLPVHITQLDSPAFVPFVSDLFLRFGVEMILSNYLGLSNITSWLIGFGLFWTSRAMRVKQLPQFIQETSRHSAIVIQEFGNADAVLKVDPRHTGSFGPNDVLIRVFAASVNPVDCRMRMGYGSSVVSRLLPSTRTSLFPLVLGRDCAGEVVVVGDAVTKFLPGDCVFAVVPVHKQGTYAQLVSVDEEFVSLKPSNADFNEAASLPWIACTAWSALVKSAGLNQYNSRGKSILVHAGTGGVGSLAVQVLKAWGAEVTVTCSAQNFTLARHLGADKVIDCTAGDFSAGLGGGYDIVVDPIGLDYEKKSRSVLKHFGGAQYICLISPEVFLSQKLGSFVGSLLFSWIYRFKIITNRFLFGQSFCYSTTEPDGKCLDAVCKMVERGEIRPLIEGVYSMDEIVAAHKHVEAGHTRGQSIITIP